MAWMGTAANRSGWSMAARSGSYGLHHSCNVADSMGWPDSVGSGFEPLTYDAQSEGSNSQLSDIIHHINMRTHYVAVRDI